jgi:hypothetical protein
VNWTAGIHLELSDGLFDWHMPSSVHCTPLNTCWGACYGLIQAQKLACRQVALYLSSLVTLVLLGVSALSSPIY